MVNTDYLPEDDLTMNSPEFEDPQISFCICSSAKILDNKTGDFVRGDNDDEPRIHSQAIMSKDGFSMTYNNAYRSYSDRTSEFSINTNNDNDDDSDSNSDDSDSDTCSSASDSDDDNDRIEQAYLYEPSHDTHLCDALNGHVHRGKVLRRRVGDPYWKLSSEECAIKAMPWNRIVDNQQRGNIENPRTELAAMHHIRAYYDRTLRNNANTTDGDGGNGTIPTAREVMRETNIIMPLDILYDDTNLYSVMPLCDGGELFHARSSLTEEICRTTIMPQILNGLEWLQRANICHRDLSLENFMLDGEGDQMRVIIIDFGMAVRIPYANDGTRKLISAQHRCGKPPYMSPEVYQQEPFDGHAVDLWAIGIILFLLLTGRHPWMYKKGTEWPNMFNEFYRHISQGHLVAICKQTSNLQMSESSMYLLRDMLLEDPRLRLSLNQIKAHRWLNEMI